MMSSLVPDDVTLNGSGTRSYAFDASGNQTQVNAAGNIVDFTFETDGRMIEADRALGEQTTFEARRAPGLVST